MRFRSMQTGLKIGQDHQIVEVLQSSWSLSLLAYRANSLYTWTFNWYCKFGSEILGLQVPEKVQTQKPRETTLKSRSQPMWSRMLLLRVSHFLFLLLRSLGDIWNSLGIRALVWGYARSLCGYLRSNLQSKKLNFLVFDCLACNRFIIENPTKTMMIWGYPAFPTYLTCMLTAFTRRL